MYFIGLINRRSTNQHLQAFRTGWQASVISHFDNSAAKTVQLIDAQYYPIDKYSNPSRTGIWIV